MLLTPRSFDANANKFSALAYMEVGGGGKAQHDIIETTTLYECKNTLCPGTQMYLRHVAPLSILNARLVAPRGGFPRAARSEISE
jgi:hypothetical protein